jgi:hypothetical protein
MSDDLPATGSGFQAETACPLGLFSFADYIEQVDKLSVGVRGAGIDLIP